MSDITYTLRIPDALLESIEQTDEEITLRFSQVHLIQVMEATFEDSLWTQAVNLTLRGYNVTGDLPECPCEIAGGDLTDNIYTYRDHAPLPIDWRGEVSCKFRATGNGAGFSVSGSALRLEQIGHPRYVKHIKKS